MSKFYSTKTFGNDRGYSCCFRQHSADSHCRFLHGYSLGFRFVFGAEQLDERNWVFDFGGMAMMKKYLADMFDHTTVIAKDDPMLEAFEHFHNNGVIDLRVLDKVGCEAFAEMVYAFAAEMLKDMHVAGMLNNPTVFIKSVEVFEHAGNSAICEGFDYGNA